MKIKYLCHCEQSESFLDERSLRSNLYYVSNKLLGLPRQSLRSFLAKTVVLSLFLVSPASAAMPQNIAISEFVKANQEYRDGKFIEASKSYEAIMVGGLESGPVYYNLANSYFKAGQAGKALLNYERARKLMPRDRDLQANEKFVLNSLPERTTQNLNFWDKMWDQHIHFYTLNEMIMIVLVIVLLFVFIFILGLYLNWSSSQMVWIRGVLVVLFLIYGTGLWVKVEADRDVNIIVRATSARFEPNEKATVYFDLSNGQRVRAREEEGDWQKIERPDGKLGWIPKNSLERL